MTAALDGGDLRISLADAGDEAVLRCDGGRYVVIGTGLRQGVVVDVEAVDSAIVVTNTTGRPRQSFRVASGAAIRNPLQVDEGVETTSIFADIGTEVPGDVVIGSRRIVLKAGVATVATKGSIDLVGGVVLRGSVTLDAGEGYVLMDDTVDGPHRLVVRSSTAAAFGGSVGGRMPLASLASDGGGVTVLGGDVVTSGDRGQAYGNDVMLAVDVRLTARRGGVRFAGAVDSFPLPEEPARSLTVRADKVTSFEGAVGATRPLARLVAKGSGSIVLGGGSVTTALGGRQVYGQPLTLTTGTVLDAGDGPIHFAGTVDGSGESRPGVPDGLAMHRDAGRIDLSWRMPMTGGVPSLTTVTSGLTTYAGAVGRRAPLQNVSREGAVFLGTVRTVPVLDYVVQASVDGGATWQTCVDDVSAATTATLTGVADGQSYDVRVWAVNGSRAGEATTGSVSARGGITFQFVYGLGAEFWSPEARVALTSTVAALGRVLAVPRPVDLAFTVTGEGDPNSRILAVTQSDRVDAGPGFSDSVVQHLILTGVDSNGSAPDGSVHWNFGYGWAFGDTVADDVFDFPAVLTHEMLHAFGFVSYVTAAGTNAGTMWTGFDRFIVTNSGTRVIEADSFQWNIAYDPNITGGQGGLFFGGPRAVAVYGGPVPLCTPEEYLPGSSVTHLDDATFTDADEKLMNAFKVYGPGVRTISPLELAILQDLGYTLADG